MTTIAIHYQPILHFIQRRVQNVADAEDLTQEVFYKLIHSSNKGVSIENPKHWLFSIARNTVIDYYRKKKMVLSELEDTKLIECNDEEWTMTEEQRINLQEYLRTLIDELPEDDQLIIRLSELEGFSQKEIAEELGLNYTTVRSKVQRGRKKLKKMISDCCEIIQGGKGSIIGYRPNHNTSCDCSSNCEKGKIYYL